MPAAALGGACPYGEKSRIFSQIDFSFDNLAADA
jgi:hypothetical protein